MDTASGDGEDAFTFHLSEDETLDIIFEDLELPNLSKQKEDSSTQTRPAFKAYVIWFRQQQLPLINGFQMAAGGFGALTATAPVEAALGVTDWRGVFFILAYRSKISWPNRFQL